MRVSETTFRAPVRMTQLKTYRVVLVEWLSHVAIIRAENAQHARDEALRTWAASEDGAFQFEDNGIESVDVEVWP